MKVKIDWKPHTKTKFKQLDERGQKLLDSEVLKSSQKYIPMDSHELERSGVKFTEFGSGKIIWQTPYARRLYWNPQYNFSKDLNPQAQGMWYEAAKASDLKSWIEMLEKLKDQTFK